MNKQEIEKAIAYWKEFKAEIPELKVSYPDAGLDGQEEFTEMAISALEHQLTNGWIPVSERFPDEGGYYIVSTQYETPRVMVGFYYTERNEWNYWMSQLSIQSVIAWQPLPEPYKEVSDERM